MVAHKTLTFATGVQIPLPLLLGKGLTMFQCPQCGSANTHVYSHTKNKMKNLTKLERYRVCKDCNYHFKTIEACEELFNKPKAFIKVRGK